MKCLIFSIGGYNFGISIDEVKEVGKQKNAKIISKEKDFSIIKYRDKNFFLFDISKIFFLSDSLDNIVFLTKFEDIAFLIGKIKGIHDINFKNISNTIFDVEYIKTFGEMENETIFILDTEKIVKSNKIKKIKTSK